MMNWKTITGVIATLTLLTACGGESSPVPDEQAMAAASGAYKTCAACHGAQGEGNQALNAPALVNLDDWYMERQLKNFRDGKRGTHESDRFGPLMVAQKATYADDATISALVSQVDSFDNVVPQATFEGDLANGEANYNMTCGACHGPNGVGNEAMGAPSLRGLDDWYITHQYEIFRNKARGSHPEDTPGMQMQRMGQVLNEQDTRNVAAWLLSLGVE